MWGYGGGIKMINWKVTGLFEFDFLILLKGDVIGK